MDCKANVYTNETDMKTISTTPTPNISKKYDPKVCHKMMGCMVQKSLEIKELSQKIWCTNRLLWHTNSDFYGIRTPTFMPYEPLLLGAGVVLNLLKTAHASQGIQYSDAQNAGLGIQCSSDAMTEVWPSPTVRNIPRELREG